MTDRDISTDGWGRGYGRIDGINFVNAVRERGFQNIISPSSLYAFPGDNEEIMKFANLAVEQAFKWFFWISEEELNKEK